MGRKLPLGVGPEGVAFAGPDPARSASAQTRPDRGSRALWGVFGASLGFAGRTAEISTYLADNAAFSGNLPLLSGPPGR